jgi:hypothetical protein
VRDWRVKDDVRKWRRFQCGNQEQWVVQSFLEESDACLELLRRDLNEDLASRVCGDLEVGSVCALLPDCLTT